MTMWNKEFFNKHGGYTLIYYLDECFVIEIVREDSKDRWCGMVRCPKYKRLSTIHDDDLDILKLSCLAKAKNFGWDIKDIRI